VTQRRWPYRRKTTLAVATALLADPDGEHYGYALTKATGVVSGTLYPILNRMQRRGWLADRWETPGPHGSARRMFRITDVGRAELAAFVEA
jgi:PadR family transcriptional regulator PadR